MKSTSIIIPASGLLNLKSLYFLEPNSNFLSVFYIFITPKVCWSCLVPVQFSSCLNATDNHIWTVCVTVWSGFVNSPVRIVKWHFLVSPLIKLSGATMILLFLVSWMAMIMTMVTVDSFFSVIIIQVMDQAFQISF